jgi:hypothetical protein
MYYINIRNQRYTFTVSGLMKAERTTGKHKVNIKLSPCLIKNKATSTHKGVTVQHPHLKLGTKWKSVLSFTVRPTYPLGKSPGYSLDRRLDGAQEKRRNPCPCRENNLEVPARSQPM